VTIVFLLVIKAARIQQGAWCEQVKRRRMPKRISGRITAMEGGNAKNAGAFFDPDGMSLAKRQASC